MIEPGFLRALEGVFVLNASASNLSIKIATKRHKTHKNDINSTNFGRVNTVFDPRIIQFVGRLQF
jgi:hypothetical protein